MSEDVGCLRVSKVVTGAEHAREARTKPHRDVTSRISDTRVRCVPTVAKRGSTRFVALVTTERPVHERTLAPIDRVGTRRRDRSAELEVDWSMVSRER